MKYIIKNKYSVVTIFEINTNDSASGINWYMKEIRKSRNRPKVIYLK